MSDTSGKSLIDFWAKWRAASKHWGSFMRKSAWSGVLVRSRRAMHASREGASKSVICGGAEVRFQKMYMLRRNTFCGSGSRTKR